MLLSKGETLSRCSTKLIHVCKKLPLALNKSRVNILCQYIIYLFLQFWACFCRSSSMLFPKAPPSCGKKKLK